MSQFYLPTRILQDTDVVVKNAFELNGFGKKALLVMGGNSAVNNGAYHDVTTALQKEKIDFVYFNGVEPNPTVGTVVKAAGVGRMNSVDFVIGIGGGSAMDAAKAVAVLLANPKRNADYLFENDPYVTHLPLVLVPTTCGSGSEVTGVSVLTVPEKKTKKSISHKVYAELALIDVKYLKTAPRELVFNTAFDALAHLIESFANTRSTDYSKMCAVAGLKKWGACRRVFDGSKFQPGENDLRKLMDASVMAGMAIAQTGTGIPHGLSYPMTYYLGIPHGRAAAYFLAGYLDCMNEHLRDQILGFIGYSEIRDYRKQYKYCFGRLEVVQKEQLIQILAHAVDELSKNPEKCATAPFPVDVEVLKYIAFYEIQETFE
ncbi:MAG: iron-containing alcohol dehydrogenase [Lachnospiraceae bacterium]|nr:iron-containing alcohol dehydrogenase [Lachnospiraceae bacterium]